MKKTLTTLLLFSLIYLRGFSQTFVVMDTNNNNYSNAVMDIYLPANSTNTTELLVKNTSSTTDTFKVVRTLQYIDALDATQFCWGGLCYGTTTNTSFQSLACPTNSTINFVGGGFHAVFNSGPACIIRLVHYKFYNIHNASDSTGITLRYICSTGIKEESKVEGNLSSIYPNPVSSSSIINYTLDVTAKHAKITVSDILGKEVKQIPLNEKQGNVQINSNEFEAGVYFYSLKVDDKIITTKKLIITK